MWLVRLIKGARPLRAAIAILPVRSAIHPHSCSKAYTKHEPAHAQGTTDGAATLLLFARTNPHHCGQLASRLGLKNKVLHHSTLDSKRAKEQLALRVVGSCRSLLGN
jgi:hypothetical protein